LAVLAERREERVVLVPTIDDSIGLHAALAAFVRPLVRPLPHLSSQRSRRREAGHPLADALLILVPSLVLAGGTVEEQIDETDIRKIPQIVWAESGSLTVPV
jgi:hypothetical protein